MLPKAGNSSTAERIELMERFLTVFGQERIQALLADREFVGREWFHYLQRQHLPFRIRLKQHTLIPHHGKQGLSAKRLFSSLKPGQARHLQGSCLLWGGLVFVLALRLEDGSLLLLATSDSPEHALEE